MERTMSPEVAEILEGRWEPLYRSQLHYLVTWGTRGRRPVLRERHVDVLRQLVQRTCDERCVPVLEVAAGSDHVHVLIGLGPTQNIASVVREIKGRAGMQLLAQFPELRVWLRGNLTWDERYSVETISAVRLARVRERLHSLHGHHEELAAAS